MIVRLTDRLAKKIRTIPAETLPADPNPFADWTARLFTAHRMQYILVTNTHSLYSLIMPGRGITNASGFVTALTNCLAGFMREDGYEQLYGEFIAPSISQVVFSKALSRSVTGSMGDFVYLAESYLADEGLSLSDVSRRINESPMSCLDYSSPSAAFRLMADRLMRG